MIWRCCLGGFGCDVAACHSAFPSNATISPCASFTETPYSGKTIHASPRTSQIVLEMARSSALHCLYCLRRFGLAGGPSCQPSTQPSAHLFASVRTSHLVNHAGVYSIVCHSSPPWTVLLQLVFLTQIRVAPSIRRAPCQQNPMTSVGVRVRV